MPESASTVQQHPDYLILMIDNGAGRGEKGVMYFDMSKLEGDGIKEFLGKSKGMFCALYKHAVK